MKAERRHELKTNSLAQTLAELPQLGRKHGGKILAAFVILLLVIVLVRMRISDAQQKAQLARENLASAQGAIAQLRTINNALLQSQRGPELYRQILDAAGDTGQRLQQMLDTEDDPALLAKTLVAKGDLHWQLAGLTQLPVAAATQPTQVPGADDLMEIARKSYQQVLEAYPQQQDAVTAARFGLAAIAEQTGDWEAARQQYKSILDDPKALNVFKDQATVRITRLEEIRQPVLLAATAQPAATQTIESQPTTQP